MWGFKKGGKPRGCGIKIQLDNVTFKAIYVRFGDKAHPDGNTIISKPPFKLTFTENMPQMNGVLYHYN